MVSLLRFPIQTESKSYFSLIRPTPPSPSSSSSIQFQSIRIVNVCAGVELPEGLVRELMPKHVAVIMDGNVRWARRRGVPSSFGHEAGEEVYLHQWGIKVLSVFAFSSDNWNRPKGWNSGIGHWRCIKTANVSIRSREDHERQCSSPLDYSNLLIRTSGELRVSNFLLWQLADTELFFARALWPDFREADFVEALSSFQERQRRYGGCDSSTANHQ